LGKGATQAQAIEEIRAFPEVHPLRNRVEELLGRWRLYVSKQDKLTTDDEELLMNLSQIYEDWRKRTLQEGYQEWREETLREGRRELFESLLKSKFGVIDEVLSQVIKRLLNLPANESSRLILQSSSREELLAKFSH
jgi:GAF domain-containing protein